MSKRQEDKLDEEIRRLVIERIKRTSDELQIVIGDEDKKFSKQELIKSVERGDEVGRLVVDIQMNFLKAMAEGKIYEKRSQAGFLQRTREQPGNCRK
jgi:hypothetical protein